MEKVMVSAGGGAIGSVLGKLTSLLENEYKHLKGVREEITFLRDELSSMHALLKRLDEVENPDEQMKEWMRQVRELSYDIEDCVDEFKHRLDHNDIDDKGFIRRTARKLKNLRVRHTIGNQIQDLKARVHEISERQKRYKLDTVDTSSFSYVAIDPRLPAFYAEAVGLVGIDGPRDELINWLQVDGEKLKVLSIVGCGGLGKTTLAMEVYRKFGSQFACRASVMVSQRPDVKKVLRDIISQVDAKETDRLETWEEGRLIRKLQEYLQNKKYFIIIDDIWSKTAWEIIKCVLPENNRGSRIITTTRIVTVALSCCDGCDGRVHEIQPLSRSNSESLFFKRIFGSKDSCPSHLKEVSDALLRKCGGMPLAIVSVASLLASTSCAKEQWERVRNSIGSPAGTNSQLEEMKQILSFSYNNLPFHLKTCLLYLSIFPEDYEIERNRLVRRWIAEGFFGEGCVANVEDIGENYFNELINRSMIQPVDIKYDGRARACRVHDMVLDLLVSKSIEHNFVTLLDAQQLTSRSQDIVRRLSLHNYNHGEHDTVLATMSLRHARSLTVLEQVVQMPPILNFRVLRVLDLEGYRSLKNHNLTNIASLFQLKYLSFRNTYIKNLPTHIGGLQYLMTLDLRGTNVEELPATVVRLRHLEHLLTHPKVKLPDGIGKMRALRRLGWIDVCGSSPSAVQELGDLANVRELEISWEPTSDDDGRYEENLLSSLVKLGSHNLRSLSVHGYSDVNFLGSWYPPPLLLQKLKMKGGSKWLSRVPKWMLQLKDISYLQIGFRELWEEDVQLLGRLPALLVLKLALTTNRTKDPMIVFRSNAFQSLTKLFFECESGLCPTFERGAMPKLETFKMKLHKPDAKSTGFRFGIDHLKLEHLPRLQRVEIDRGSADDSEVEAVKAAITNATNIHPNRPTLHIHDNSCKIL